MKRRPLASPSQVGYRAAADDAGRMVLSFLNGRFLVKEEEKSRGWMSKGLVESLISSVAEESQVVKRVTPE